MILSATNPYALDVVLAQIMHTDPMGILTIQNSAERGLVKMDEVQCIFPQGGRLLVYEDFKLPKSKGVDFTGSVPKFLKRPVGYLFGSLLSPRPVVQREKCIGCGKCKESCPQHTIAIQNHKAYIHKNNCIRCYCCHEMCPVRAISIKRSRLFDM